MIGQFAEISRKIGMRADYVQGGGGNTSVKLDERRMAVKASGTLLKDINAESGYVVVDFPAVCDLLQMSSNADAFARAVNELTIAEGEQLISARPSIETGFHALLGTFVVHTHSVYVNVLTCCGEGEAICKELFPEALWVPYCAPGLELTRQISRGLKERRTDIVFLQNHGVIVSADDGNLALSKHQSIADRIIRHLTLPQFDTDELALDLDFIKRHVLFPDQVVFTMGDRQLLSTRAGSETLCAYAYIDKMIERLRLTHHYLADSDIADLLGMETEKYRQSIAQ